MKKLAYLPLVVSLLTFSTSLGRDSNIPPSADNWLNGATGYDRAIQLQQELNLPLVVYFYADWCPYCQSLDARYLPAPEVQDYLRRVVKVRVNPEHGRAERELAARYGVTGYPAFFVVRSGSSRPTKIHPFTQEGNLSPAQFARACWQAAPVSNKSKSAFNTDSSTTSRQAVGTTQTVARQERSGGVQMVMVKPAIPNSPNVVSSGPLPTVDEVLKRYVEAIGGRDAYLRLTSRVIKGRVDVPGVSNGGQLEMYAKAPNKSLSIMNLDSIGIVQQGFDGRSGWDQSAALGLRPATGDQLAGLSRDSEFYSALNLRALYARMKLRGMVKDGFRHVYVIDATPRIGSADVLYFDSENGLLVRRDTIRSTSRGPVQAEMYFNDWRDVDGVKLPFRMTQTMPDRTFVFTIEEVKHNVPVDESIFHKPSK